MVSSLWVSNKVFAPVLAAAVHASEPACPPPITITSNFGYSGSLADIVTYVLTESLLKYEHRILWEKYKLSVLRCALKVFISIKFDVSKMRVEMNGRFTTFLYRCFLSIVNFQPIKFADHYSILLCLRYFLIPIGLCKIYQL